MSQPSSHEFLSLTTRGFQSEDEGSSPIQPHLDTLFAEFARTRTHFTPPPRPMTSQSLNRPAQRLAGTESRAETSFDLRALEYVSEYDSHLMCPICHVPFIDPVVVDCDHTFCSSCLDEYRVGDSTTDRSRCPSCRSYLLGVPRKASRLITNMCNDIRVCCPNTDCSEVMARGCVEYHTTRDCPEESLNCPDSNCTKLTKRKHLNPDQCIHNTHIKCDCGAVIELGRGEWLKHRDEQCPETGSKCNKCGERIALSLVSTEGNQHTCATSTQKTCPGAEFGCSDNIEQSEFEAHISLCSMARLAPYMKKQSLLIKSLQEQVTMTNMRNEVLESSIDRINDLFTHQIQPKIDHLPIHDPEVEEIERDHIPGPNSHRDLLLPAHVRELTPSPTPNADQNISNSQPFQHLLALHEGLRDNLDALEHDMVSLSHNVADMDARSSMQLMNETLRLKEELAHTNAALFSTRAQVQWLLNRERIASQQQTLGMMRGRQSTGSNNAFQTSSHGQQATASDVGGTSYENTATASAAPSAGPSPVIVASDNGTQPGSSSSSAAASPMFASTRPGLRRMSGGSQERVKL